MKMRFRKPIILLGVITALLPFVGVPHSWKQWLFVMAGVVITILGLLADERTFKQEERSHSPIRKEREHLLDNEKEHGGPEEDHIA